MRRFIYQYSCHSYQHFLSKSYLVTTPLPATPRNAEFRLFPEKLGACLAPRRRTLRPHFIYFPSLPRKLPRSLPPALTCHRLPFAPRTAQPLVIPGDTHPAPVARCHVAAALGDRGRLNGGPIDHVGGVPGRSPRPPAGRHPKERFLPAQAEQRSQARGLAQGRVRRPRGVVQRYPPPPPPSHLRAHTTACTGPARPWRMVISRHE